MNIKGRDLFWGSLVLFILYSLFSGSSTNSVALNVLGTVLEIFIVVGAIAWFLQSRKKSNDKKAS